jgi:hypothetical protein
MEEYEDDDPPELEDIDVVPPVSTLMFDIEYCKYETHNHLGRILRTCYQPQVKGSAYCYEHKCKSCDKPRAKKAEYCMKCPCPVVGCELEAWACGERCPCCDSYHRLNDEQINVTVLKQCANCVCVVCGAGPVIKRHGGWRAILLCKEHGVCKVVKCGKAVDIDNPRYCPHHKHSICNQIRTLDLCLVREGMYFDMRILICKWYRWYRDNCVVCKICKKFYQPTNFVTICNTCIAIRENALKEIDAEEGVGYFEF